MHAIGRVRATAGRAMGNAQSNRRKETYVFTGDARLMLVDSRFACARWARPNDVTDLVMSENDSIEVMRFFLMSRDLKWAHHARCRMYTAQVASSAVDTVEKLFDSSDSCSMRELCNALNITRVCVCVSGGARSDVAQSGHVSGNFEWAALQSANGTTLLKWTNGCDDDGTSTTWRDEKSARLLDDCDAFEFQLTK